jgi:hypothetical protein
MDAFNFKQYFNYKKPTPKINHGGRIGKLNFNYFKAKKDKGYPFLASSSMFSILERTDEAMLNSILSFSVYDRNSWMMENLKSDLSDMTTIVHDAMKSKEKMYGLKVWHFMKNTFEKIPDHELKIPAEKILINSYKYETHFYFKDGQYSAANGLAHASVLKSKSLDGDGEVLHLTFRGTEFSRLTEYLKGPYLDMSAYYAHFAPLALYIRDYVNNPINNITEVHVNGHSLGGAMVQEFLKNNPADEFAVPIKGFTFGSPGSEKNWYHKLATLAYHSLGRGIIMPEDTSTNVPDDRITQFYHSNDPVPLVGLLGYNKGGNTYQLPDVAYEESKKANLENKGFLEKIPAFGKLISYFKETVFNKFDTKFHDSARYIMNLRNHIESHYKEYPQLGEIFSAHSTRNWQNFLKEERSFSALSIKYRSAFEYLVKQDEPNLTAEGMNNKVLQIRESMKYDSEADVVLSKMKSSDNYYKFLNNLTTLRKNAEGQHSNSALTEESVIAASPADRVKLLKEKYGKKMESRESVFKKT